MESAKSESKTVVLLLMGYIMIYMLLSPGHEINRTSFSRSHSLLPFNHIAIHCVSTWHGDVVRVWIVR